MMTTLTCGDRVTVEEVCDRDFPGLTHRATLTHTLCDGRTVPAFSKLANSRAGALVSLRRLVNAACVFEKRARRIALIDAEIEAERELCHVD